MNSTTFAKLLQNSWRGCQRRYNSGLIGYPNYRPLPPPPPGPLYPIHPNWLLYVSAGLLYGLHVLNKDDETRKMLEEEGKFMNIKLALDAVLPLVAETEKAASSGYAIVDSARNEVKSNTNSVMDGISGFKNKVLEGVLNQMKAIVK
eukprot:GFUD01008996.1.p1 GENE.GFUD01008996.1~~GFUD01008996.1.p1  ORF type:complete len:147 (-),score=37.85 GFUD01008996.1:500-940(-)